MHAFRIEEVRASRLDLPLTEPFAVATGAQDVARNVLVSVRLASGVVGLGEAAPFPAVTGETQERTLHAIASIAPKLVDADVRSWRALTNRVRRLLPAEPAARAGIEMAVFDALARGYGMPLHAMFGGDGTELETDMTVTAGDTAHAERSARSIARRGFRSVKVKIGALAPEQDAERVAKVTAAAPALKLLVDANGGYTADEALEFLANCAARGVRVDLFEQPVAADDRDGLARVHRASSVPVCADESARSEKDVIDIVRHDRASVINIKITKTGVAEALSIWSIARAAGLDLMMGEMVEGPLATSFYVHFAAGLGGFRYVDLDTPFFVASHTCRAGYRAEGPRLVLDDAAVGHGAFVEE